MSHVVNQYVELFETQLLERAISGGALSEDREGEYVERFDELWRRMTTAEQSAIEDHLASQPEAPDDLNVVDVEVAGGHVPRRAA